MIAAPVAPSKLEMKKIRKCISAAAVFLAFAPNAIAGSAYDGSWNLVFLTQRGACDPTYDFVVNIPNGIITHPNLLKFRGYVAKSGAAATMSCSPTRRGLEESSPSSTEQSYFKTDSPAGLPG